MLSLPLQLLQQPEIPVMMLLKKTEKKKGCIILIKNSMKMICLGLTFILKVNIIRNTMVNF
eukprot:5157725-Ditylum_brightwellii.AAC.1